MSKQHLTSFKVENFKRFDSLELTDIGQFNLIVGDNNVGKTSLLEAISVLSDNDPSDPYAHNLSHTLNRRGIDTTDNVDLFFKYLARNENKVILFDFVLNSKRRNIIFEKKPHPDFPTLGVNQLVYSNSQDRHLQVPVSLLNSPQNPSLVPLNIETNGQLYREYQNTIGLDRTTKHLIVNNLKVVDNHIVEIEVLPLMGQSHVMVGFDNTNLYMPITGLGESAVRVFYYLLHIIQNRGQRLMLDEIDTGIHYSRMKGFLKNIIQLADKNEVQLFMTTHSLECQEAFAEVFEEPDMVQHQAKARQFTLIEKPDGQIVASGRNFEQLQSALETGYDTRGGKRGW